jgi:lon-related putative ATP-dependent protease
MSNIESKCRIPLDRLTYTHDESTLDHDSSAHVDPCCSIIGQDEAVSSMEMGFGIESRGYNIFVTGLSGTGRTTAVTHILEEFTKDKKVDLKDLCYVHNFKFPERPAVLYFEAGEGIRFKKRINYLIDSLITVMPKIFSGENYRERRTRIVKEFENRQKDLLKNFEKKVTEKGMVLVQLQIGPALRPDIQALIDDKPVSVAELEKLAEEGKFPQDEFEKMRTSRETLLGELEDISQTSRKISENLERELEKLDKSYAVPLVEQKVDTLKGQYEDKKIQKYLDELHDEILQGLDIFRRETGDGEREEAHVARLRVYFNQFRVNLLIDNSDQSKPPVIRETFASYKNLFGTIERSFDPIRGWQSDFTKIRAGSLLRANGGYLIINATDLFMEPAVWPMLKRTLRDGKLDIAAVDPMYMFTTGIKPEAVHIDVKVVLIGEARVYDILLHNDEEFKKVFKVKAEFDNVMTRSKESVEEYAQFIKKICAEDDLLAFDRSGMAAIVEYGVKFAGRKDRLSTQFTKIADLIRESSWQASKNNGGAVARDDVKKAYRNQIRRMNLIERKVRELYERDLYLIDLKGETVGQINGLSVHDLGEHAFGRPVRITATISPGADGVINIEREAAMSGHTHDKGVLILSGFMRQRFARKRPLVFSASICFEQSYTGVDGDSASSTEVYAILSALSGKPIRQNLAVTGSVNQKGEIQPIGGVNEKIEGFFDVCSIDGLTGDQGVLIPRQNMQDLMLKDDVLDAVRDGRFHLFAIDHIDEGIELLTGVPSGELQSDGTFPEGSINHVADAALAELAEVWRDYIRHF